jgi:cyclophilin family peptidyl-prolyl cis-trans isomerase
VGIVTGTAFVDANANGARDAGETALPGIIVNLSGTASATGAAVNLSTAANANGAYTFTGVVPGTYHLTSGPGGAFLGGGVSFPTFTISAGQTVTQDLAFGGVAPAAISLRMFLNSSGPASLPFAAAGSGQAIVDRPPTVSTAVADQAVTAGTTNTVLDLAGNFTDPDITDTQVRFDTSDGPINVTLSDTQTPRTVANFLNYVTSGRYDNSIFHRLIPNFALQGGGFTFNPSGPSLPAIATDPAVQSEFKTSNTIGTLALALPSGANNVADPNAGTDEFFFNLADNSSSLDPQKFTVFGQINGPADQTVINTLAATPTKDESSVNGSFMNIPLSNYAGANFPKDTTAANYLIVKDIAIVSRGDVLTYSVVNNSNPTLVTPTVKDNRLTLQYATGQTGSATITVRATDRFGLTVDQTFTVTVS